MFNLRQTKSALVDEQAKIKQALRKQTITYITAAFGLVAGLAWNDAVKSTIEYLIPLEKNGLWAKFLYAIIITLILVFIADRLARLAAEPSSGEHSQK